MDIVKIYSSSLTGTSINIENCGDRKEYIEPGSNKILASVPQTRSVPSTTLSVASASVRLTAYTCPRCCGLFGLAAAFLVVHSYSIEEDGFALADGPVAAAVVVYTVAQGLVAGVALAGFE